MNYDVIIIGGGAAGLACAANLVQGGKNIKILLVDAGERFGKKLAATGNGQGNISNADMSVKHFHGGNCALVEKIVCADAYAGVGLFDCLFTADASGRIFPAGKQASALVDNLLFKLKNSGNVKFVSGCTVNAVKKVADGFSVCGGALGDGSCVSKYVVFCTGGKAQKQFKTDGTAYSLATHFGHTLTALYPSLVQIKTDAQHIKTLKGIRADCVVSAIYNGKTITKNRGDVIFTEYGVSGNAVFSVSSYITDKQGVTLNLEFLPDFSQEEICKNLSARKKRGCPDGDLLSGTLHNQIGRVIIKRAGSASAEKIAQTLKNFTLEVTGNLGFDYAQVTKGGIKMDEVSEELESKLVKNAFFAGEILDVDGDCGGYNLQWAFTSGQAAAEAIIKRL